MSLSGLKDIDREIFSKLDDNYLLKACSIDKNTWFNTCNDAYLKRRMGKYPEIEKNKRENENWKTFFSRFVYYKMKMKQKKYRYRFGDFQTQWDILKQSNFKSTIFMKAIEKGEIALIKWCINYFRKNKHCMQNYNYYLCYANDVKTIKYLFKEGFIYDFKELVSKTIENKKLDLLKYYDEINLLNKDIYNYGLLQACLPNRRLEIIKYLIEKGASNFNDALLITVKYCDFEASQYLMECGANNFINAIIEATKYVRVYNENGSSGGIKQRIKIIDLLLKNKVDLLYVLNNTDPYDKCREIEDYLKSKLSFKDKIKYKCKI